MHGPIKPGTFEPSPPEAARRDLLAVSEENSDGGELVGRDPREVPPAILLRYHKAKSPLRAIRERCLDCCCDQPSEVRKCTAVHCPSWPFRMGTNPFREKRVLSGEQKEAIASRLAKARGHRIGD
jgi:hypothetical protein